MKRSKLWKHFDNINKVDLKAKCRYCCKFISFRGGGTTNLSRHLIRVHGVHPHTRATVDNLEEKTNANKRTDASVSSVRQEPEHSVWKYFKDCGGHKSKCNFCSKILYGTTFNLNRHLNRFHPSANKSVDHLPGISPKISDNPISDPLIVKLEREDIAQTRQSSLFGSSNKKFFRKSLARSYQEKDEALDIISEDIHAKPKITKVSQPRFALSWESHQNRLCSKLNTLLLNEDFVDLTLAAGGHLVKVHQLVMSIASPYLKEIIHSSPARHPIIFLNNVSYTTLRHLLQYVYTGQVDITEEELEPFFAAAKALQIQGIDTEIDTDVLKLQADNQIGDATKLPPDPNITAAQEDGSNADELEESQILTIPRSATTRTSNSPDTERILSKHRYTCSTSQTKKKLLSQAKELETEDFGDMVMDEDMMTVASEDSSGGLEPVEFYEVSHTDDPDPVKTPPTKNTDSDTVQTMLLTHYKYALARTFAGGVRKWQCIDYLKHNCQARTVTIGNTVIERSEAHNHPYHDMK